MAEIKVELGSAITLERVGRGPGTIAVDEPDPEKAEALRQKIRELEAHWRARYPDASSKLALARKVALATGDAPARVTYFPEEDDE